MTETKTKGNPAVQFKVGPDTVRVTVPDRAGLLAQVAARLAARQGFAVATLNLDHLVKLAADPAFRAAYRAHDLVTADGNPVVWLSRLARSPVALVPGADLVLPLVRLAAGAGRGVALVGSTKASLSDAAAWLTAQVPGLRISALIAPPMGFDPASDAAAAILSQLADSDTGLCLIALGAPRQEALAARGRALTPAIGFASVGAGLDFLSGQQRRAPAWARRLALEWLWRMLSDPVRLTRRYVQCTLILPGHARRSWLLGRGAGRTR